MPQPFDSTVVLNSFSNLIREQYYPDPLRNVQFFGNAVNRIPTPAARGIQGDGETFQRIITNAFSMSSTTNVMDDFPLPRTFRDARYKVRFNQSDPNSNDLSRWSGTIRLSEFEVNRASSDEGAAVSLMDEHMKQFRENYDFAMSVFRHSPRSGRLATVSTDTPKNNDHRLYASATSYTTGASSCRVIVSNGSVAIFQPGLCVDLFSAAGALQAKGLRVTDYNPIDNSVGLTVDSTDPSVSTQNCNSVAASAEIFLRDSRNAGFYSLGAWFSVPTSTDSFIGGINRSSADNRDLQVTMVGEGETARPISKYDFDTAADALGYVTDRPAELAVVADPRLLTRLRQDLGEDIIIMDSTSEQNADRRLTFGAKRLAFQHPVLNTLVLMGDSLAPPNTLRMVVPGDWRTIYFGQQGINYMPGNVGGSLFSRMASSIPSRGGSMSYQLEAYSLSADVCLNPRRQCAIINRTA